MGWTFGYRDTLGTLYFNLTVAKFMKLENFLENYFPGVANLEPTPIIFYDEPNVFHQDMDLNKIISWPPNVFLILYSILEYTDKYRLIVSPQEHFRWKKSDLDVVQSLSKQWLDLLSHQVNFLDDRPVFHAPELKKISISCI